MTCGLLTIYCINANFSTYLLRLSYISWKAIQQEAKLALWFLQIVLDHTDHQIVVDQFALIHHFLDLSAKGRTGLNLSSEHITCRQVTHTVPVFEQWSLKQVEFNLILVASQLW